MATYTIVDKDKDPLDPGEINASSTIQVSDGDTFIIDPTANGNIAFEAAGGGPASFDIQVSASNTSDFKLEIKDDLSSSITVADNIDISNIEISASNSDGVTLMVGDNVSMHKFTGSSNGADIIDIGDGFTTAHDWDTKGGDDEINVGNFATFKNINTGDGTDTLVVGDDATVQDIDTGENDDTVRFGDNADLNSLKTGKGDDTIYLGANTSVSSVDGQGDNDTLYTQTTGLNEKNIESTNVVCFADGTLIETDTGPVAVEALHVGHMVRTLDHGFQPLRWIGRMQIGAGALRRAERLRPIRFSAGSLGRGLPSQNLRVSPQHRILVRSDIATRMFGCAEIFVAAKKLTDLPGISVQGCDADITYFHLLFDRHEIVFAEGAACESLYLGAQALGAFDPQALAEIRAAVPGCARPGHADTMARPCPKGGAKLSRLLERHIRNYKPIVTHRQLAAAKEMAG